VRDDINKPSERDDEDIKKNKKQRRKKHIHSFNQLFHKIGYKNIGTGDICALIIRRATIMRRRSTGIIHILFDLVRRI